MSPQLMYSDLVASYSVHAYGPQLHRSGTVGSLHAGVFIIHTYGIHIFIPHARDVSSSLFAQVLV